MPDSVPSTDNNNENFAVQVDASVRDERTGALFIHKDLVKVRGDWEVDQYVGPPKADEQLGDVASWAAYVSRFSVLDVPFLTWSSRGLRAVMDYFGAEGEPGRQQWIAAHPFERTGEWKGWAELVQRSPWSQRTAIEKLEDLGVDIVEPTQAELMTILRSLRATVNSSARTEMYPDGTTSVQFNQDKTIKPVADLKLPSEFAIAIPVLKGHATRYRLTVKLRPSVDDQSHLTLRFAIPNADATLEAVFAEVVAEAKAALGERFSILRAAG